MTHEELLRAARDALNELPNIRLYNVEGYADTYKLVSAIGRYIDGRAPTDSKQLELPLDH